MRTLWLPGAWLLIASLLALAGCAEPPVPRKLSGPGLTGQPARSRPPGGRLLAVMVENQRAARPQSGLDRADVVFEALVEGGITRFMAIYSHNDVPEIGPVRSARPYFVSLAQPFDPVYVHCGESNSAIEVIRESGLAELDEMVHPSAFWRDRVRRKPHNLYTSTERLWKHVGRLGLQESPTPLPFPFDRTPPAGQPVPGVDIGYRYGERYDVRWRYDPRAGLYRRWINGMPHRDRRTNRQLIASSIYVLLAPTELYLRSTGEMQIDLVGSGRAWLLRDGVLLRGTWARASDANSFDLYDDRGHIMAALPGPLWVQIIPDDRSPRFPPAPRRDGGSG